MDALTRTRQQLDDLLADLHSREQAVAHATELLSQDASVQAAWRQGAASERDRVLMLIDHQLATLAGAGMNAMVLAALRRMVVEVEP
jgi:predicted deacylase